MRAKFGEARRQAFLAALRECGNQTLAAERTKVSPAWVKLHRASDPEFRRASDEAIAEAADRLGGQRRPPSGWGFLDGAELVVRGTGGAGGAKRVQIARARLKQWSPRVEKRFLAALAATCNVRAACAEVGMAASTAYDHRKRWPAFAERWDAALQSGYDQIECGLIEAACNLFSSDGPAEIGPIRGMTADLAIVLLGMHKNQVHRNGKRSWLRAREPDIEDVRAEILRKVDALQRRDERRLERDRAEWARRREGARLGR